MTNEPRTTAASAAELAPFLLDDLMGRLGVAGRCAALAEPGLLAQVDQHCAAVREALGRAGRAADAPGLAGYARSIEAAAHRMGRPPLAGDAVPTGEGWLRAEWHLLRLLAVCMVAEAEGVV